MSGLQSLSAITGAGLGAGSDLDRKPVKFGQRGGDAKALLSCHHRALPVLRSGLLEQTLPVADAGIVGLPPIMLALGVVGAAGRPALLIAAAGRAERRLPVIGDALVFALFL